MSLENYFDYHFSREKRVDGNKFSSLGDFGTIFEFTPFSDFTLRSDMLIDTNDFIINKYSTSFSYGITSRWKVSTIYNYQADYDQRSVYSMGSGLTDITSGSSFLRRFSKTQNVSFNLDFPIRESTRGEFGVIYNLNDKILDGGRLKLVQNLHCWEVALEYTLKQRRISTGDKENQHNIMFMLYLTASPSIKIQAKQGRTTGVESDDTLPNTTEEQKGRGYRTTGSESNDASFFSSGGY
jgi:hypothetical protein